MTWNWGWKPTTRPGIYAGADGFRIRVRAVDRLSGRLLEANRIAREVTLEDAEMLRRSMRDALLSRTMDPAQRTVKEFGLYWLEVKRGIVDPGTLERYEAALKDHAFHSLGRVDLRDLGSMRVQEWINAELKRGYRVSTVKGWFRAFRTMVRDGMEDLALDRDPTRRVRFPVADPRPERNALQPGQLQRFLSEMKLRAPRHHALAAVLAFTGLRFCHASALRWEDFDEENAVLRIRRRQLRKRVGPVTAVKRAPKEYPVAPQLIEILKQHRRARKRNRPRKRGWIFPSATGGLRCPASLQKPWRACLKAAGITERFTVHGLRRTFVDLARKARVDPIVTRSLTGHVTEKMHIHYSSVDAEEQRCAVATIARLASGDSGGDAKQTGSSAG